MSSIQQPPSQSSTSESTGSPAANPTTDSSSSGVPTTSDDSFPEQRHAGAVGYGPNYHAGPSLEEKMAGLKEEVKGKLTRNPEKVQHGREVYSGEEKRKKLTGEDEPNPFENANDDKSEDPNAVKNDNENEKKGESVQLPSGSTEDPNTQSETPTSPSTQAENNPKVKATPGGMAVGQGHGPGAKEQAATVAPEGTHEANVQKDGGAVDHVKQIDERN